MQKHTISFLAILTLSLGGCATAPSEITPTYVSPLIYKDYDCDQLTAEYARVSRRISDLHGVLKKKADGDNAQMGVGMLLFWPTLFALDGDGADTQEYARLKGEANAIESASIQKKCGIEPVRPPPPKPTEVTDVQEAEES